MSMIATAVCVGFIALIIALQIISCMRESAFRAFLVIGSIITYCVAVLASMILSFTGIDYHYSDGERSGKIIKMSNKGLVFKTWEGQLSTGATVVGAEGGSNPLVFQFSVCDKSVIEKLKDAQKTNQQVTLNYVQPLLVGITEGDSDYLITDCQPLSK